MRKFLAALIALAPLALPAMAAGPVRPPAIAAPLAADQQADIARILAYLNGLGDATADFTFVGPDGQPTKGKFSLDRPSRLRFEYTEPKGNLLIADGDYVIFWDAQQKESSNLPIGRTPLAFLLKPQISFTDGVSVVHFEHDAGVIRVTLEQTKDPDAGSVTVAFADQPLQLRGWRLVDGQAQITDVSFENWNFGMKLDSSLFHFKEPNDGKRHR